MTVVRPTLGNYLKRFPELRLSGSPPTKLIEEEYRARRLSGESPGKRDYALVRCLAICWVSICIASAGFSDASARRSRVTF